MGQRHIKNIIGNIQLKQSFNPQQSKHNKHSQIIKSLSYHNSWDYSNGNLKNYNLQQIFCLIKSATVISLNLTANNNQRIPSILQNIAFPKLMVLKICGNNITSIQCLIFLKAENLAELSMSWNNITESRSLKKCHFPWLKYLNVEQNFLPNLGQDLSLCNFPWLKKVLFESTSKSLVVCENLEMSCIKWRSSDLYEIKCMSSRRIPKTCKINLLKQKYTHLKFYKTTNEKYRSTTKAKIQN